MKIDETRDKILNVAATIFSKFGFHKTTVDEIARAAYKAKGSVYYHFKSKEGLFQRVIDKEFQMLRGELIKAKLYSGFEEYVPHDYFVKRHKLYQIFF
ncbi:MAG: TetR/AcrR family transcriptional regulator [Bacteroidales bacterium]|nr:TetR/AcrR family transcriptional regulator [Bacteroidales bacterium]